MQRYRSRDEGSTLGKLSLTPQCLATITYFCGHTWRYRRWKGAHVLHVLVVGGMHMYMLARLAIGFAKECGTGRQVVANDQQSQL